MLRSRRITMITTEELEAAGYRRHAPTGRQHAVTLWQRWIRDETTKFYAINFYEYAPMNFGQSGIGTLPTSFEAEVHLYTAGSDDTGFDLAIRVVKYPQRETLEQVEEFFRKACHALGCIPDPHNQP